MTTWGVYPLGYMLTMTSIDLNYIHIAFTGGGVKHKRATACWLRY